MARNEVLSRMEKGKLDAALIDLYRKARSDLEEGGSNTLFLAVGFLRWKKAEDDPKSYFAPLILAAGEIGAAQRAVRGEDVHAGRRAPVQSHTPGATSSRFPAQHSRPESRSSDGRERH